jgi:NAD(P)-dependent dehydrogenase (short-subunit alcohol dehydrogenase family)
VTTSGTHDLTGTVGVVTGGNGGIGLGLALGLAKAGADVAIWGRNAVKNEAAAARVRALGRRCAAYACDIADEGQVTTAFARTVGEFGRVDSFFANAGVPGDAVPFTDMTLGQWRGVLGVNLDGTFLCLREAARHMVAGGQGGAIVAVSSIITFYGGAEKEHYAVTRSGAEALARALAVELAVHRIRVNSLAPGWTDTELTAEGSGFIPGASYDKVREYTRRRTPVRRWASPDEIGAVAAFLADKTLTFHTGDNLVVDGGYTKF